MTDISIALANFRFEDVAALAGLDPELLRPGQGSAPDAWLVAVLEHVAGQRTHESEIIKKLEAGDRLGALRLTARAAERSVSISPSTDGKIAGTWAALTTQFERNLQEVREKLGAIGADAPNASELAQMYAEELAEIPQLGHRPQTSTECDIAFQALNALRRLRQDADVLEFEARKEAEERAGKVRSMALAAVTRLLELILSSEPSPQAQRWLEAFPSLVIERRAEMLEALATGDFDAPVLEAGFLGLGMRAPRSRKGTAQRHLPIKVQPAEKELSTASRTQLANTPQAERGLASTEDVRRFEVGTSQMPDEQAAGVWLSLVASTRDPEMRALALGRGLLALGRYQLVERRHPRLAVMHLSDALACIVDAGQWANPSEVTRVVAPLVVAKAWDRLPQQVLATHRQLEDWIDAPDALFGWVQREAHHDVIARVWSETKRDDVARELLNVAREHLEGHAALLRDSAEVLLGSPQRFESDPDLVSRRLKELLEPAEPGEELFSCLDQIADEVGGLEPGQSNPQSATYLSLRRDEIVRHLEALPNDTDAPLDEIRDLLPKLIDARIKGQTHEVLPQIHVSPIIGAVFPERRQEEVRLPVRVSNGPHGAPVADLYLQLALINDELSKGLVRFSTGKTQEERAVGGLDSGEETEVSFYIDISPSLLESVTEVRFRASLRVSDKVVEDTTFGVPIRPLQGMPQESPYATGTAVTGQQFVGRNKEVRAIRSAIDADGVGRTPLVFGIRRIGKTSIIKQLAQAPEVLAHFVPIYMSFEDFDSSRTTVDLLRYICEEVRAALPKELHDRLRVDRRTFNEEPYVAFERFFQALDGLRPAKRVLLILDEFDKLLHLTRETEERKAHATAPLKPNEVLQSEVFGALRKVIMSSRFVRMIFAGLPGLRLSRYEDRLFGLLTPILVQSFNDKEALQVLDAAGEVMRFDLRARNKIFDATGRHPYLLQLACHNLFCRMEDSGRNLVTAEDVDEMIQSDLLPYEAHFTDYMKLITEEDIPIFRAIATIQKETGHRRRFVSIEAILRELDRQGQQMTRSDLEERLAMHEKDERPLIAYSPSHRSRLRLAIGLIGDRLLQ